MVKEKAKTTDPSGSGNMLWVEGEVAVEGPYGGIDRRRYRHHFLFVGVEALVAECEE